MQHRTLVPALALLLSTTLACTGSTRRKSSDDPDPDVGGSSGAIPGTTGSNGEHPSSSGREPLVGPPTRSAGARRLTRDELSRSLGRLLGADVPVDTGILPNDTLTPFDNDVVEQSPSMVLVEAVESIARDAAAFVTATPERMQRVLPCTPSGGGDAACFGKFIDGFGKRVLRQPLDAAFAQEMKQLISYGQASGKFADAVDAALRVFLQHPAFLYRIEPGLPASGGRVRLTGYEVATRLSFLLQGMTPDDALLAAAERGALDSSAGVRAEAVRLLATAEGKEQLHRFHALWLGYSPLNTLPIHRKLRAETDALVDRATEPDRDYRELLLSDETYIDAELAAHYGMGPGAAAPEWVPYGSAPRRGIISQGMFAAAGAKFGDTSPTRRGKFVRERLLCTPIALPPPAVNVDVDLPPAAKSAGACKSERYRQHRADPSCAGCHALMDPIGFGLENFDELGRYRTHDTDRPDCPIDGHGELDPKTPFTGARELAGLVAAAPEQLPCVAQQFIHFAIGRAVEPNDLRRAQWLAGEMEHNGHSFQSMLLAFVSHDDFRIREE
jgi:hypothetical protein